MKIRIEPYKTWSGGARALGERLGILRATHKQVQKHGDFDVIINWGRTERRFNGRYINEPEAVLQASDKLTAFNKLQEAGDVPIPRFTDSRDVAQEWLGSGFSILARSLRRGSQGRGITLVHPPNGDNSGAEDGTPVELGSVPLYVEYVKKRDEFRVHVAFGQVIDITQKRRDTDVPDDAVNWQIRNHGNGWVFTRGDVDCPPCVRSAAVNAVRALGLDFGAVDVGYNAHHDSACVYEVNTAPGLEGTTLDRYARAFYDELPISGGRYQLRRRARGHTL